MILAIIPIRSGSKGIPGKNLIKVDDKNLIEIAIQKLSAIESIDKIVLASDTTYYFDFIHNNPKIIPFLRDSSISSDSVTLDVTISKVMRDLNLFPDLLITHQATSPTIKSKTISDAINFMSGNEYYNSLITVKENKHLFWISKKNEIKPFHSDRLNRQFLDPIYVETGGLVITRNYLPDDPRLLEPMYPFILKEEEAIDIDNYSDVLQAKFVVQGQKLAYYLVYDKKTGTGHLKRALALIPYFGEFQINFIVFCEDDSAKLVFSELHYEFVIFKDVDEYLNSHRNSLGSKNYFLSILDCLDTNEDFVLTLRRETKFLVSFENLGDGIKFCDLVINAMYKKPDGVNLKNCFFGSKYEILSPEYHKIKIPPIKSVVEEILITFGGSDPMDYSYKIYEYLCQDNISRIKYTIVLGKSYNGVLRNSNSNENIFVQEGVPSLKSHIYNADIIICSAGRTTFEIASMGIPSIVLVQNERESLHTFATHENGFLNCARSIDLAMNSLKDLIQNFELRRDLRFRMLDSDIKDSSRNVISLIKKYTI